MRELGLFSYFKLGLIFLTFLCLGQRRCWDHSQPANPYRAGWTQPGYTDCYGVRSGVKPKFPARTCQEPDLIPVPGHCRRVAPGHSSSPAVKHGCTSPVPEDQLYCPGGDVERPRGLQILPGGTEGFAKPLRRNQGCCWRKKELVYRLVAQTKRILHVSGQKINWGLRLGGRQRDREVPLLDLGRGSHCTLLCGVAASCFAFLPFPFNRLPGTSLPGIQGHPTPPPHSPSPSAHHNPSQSSPEPSSTVAPQPFVPFYPLGHNSSTTCPSLPPSCP